MAALLTLDYSKEVQNIIRTHNLNPIDFQFGDEIRSEFSLNKMQRKYLDASNKVKNLKRSLRQALATRFLSKMRRDGAKIIRAKALKDSGERIKKFAKKQEAKQAEQASLGQDNSPREQPTHDAKRRARKAV